MLGLSCGISTLQTKISVTQKYFRPYASDSGQEFHWPRMRVSNVCHRGMHPCKLTNTTFNINLKLTLRS